MYLCARDIDFAYFYYIKTTGVSSGAGTALISFRSIQVRPPYKWGSCYSISCFVDRRLSLVIFLSAIVLLVFLRFTDSDYPLDIFKLSFIGVSYWILKLLRQCAMFCLNFNDIHSKIKVYYFLYNRRHMVWVAR